MTTQQRSSPSGPLAGRKVASAIVDTVVTAATVAVITTTVAGVRTTDLVRATNADYPLNLAFGGARVSAANEVEIQIVNPSAGNISSGALTFTFEIGGYTS